MPRKGSDTFGDQVSGPPAPNHVPSEKAQLRRRHLNDTGLPHGVRDDLRSGGVEDGDSKDRPQDTRSKTTTTRTRKSKRRASRGKNSDDESDKKEDDADAISVGTMGLSERLRSPLGSTLKLDELREQISKGVEIK